jgi:Na+-translocating ferredoxin:NAD+ oxidoreductase RNF subunit RnfB
MSIILVTLGVSVVLAFLIGAGLGFFQEKFKVPRDPKIDQVRAVLPGANCGACGFPGCDAYAEAVCSGGAQPDKCSVGGSAAAKSLAEILGVAVSAEDKIAVLLCQGSRSAAPEKGRYVGLRSCAAAKISAGGVKLCAWGCYGYGDCERACSFGAITIGEAGLPRIDRALCTGCGKCALACPQKVLSLLPRERHGAIALCCNKNPVKALIRKTCSSGCFKCELCVKACTAGAISFANSLPLVDYSLCTSCGACVEKCPDKVFSLLPKELAS